MPIFHLTLRGPLHQGEFVGINREAALDWIPSDSLFAMLVTAWTQTGVDMASRLAGFEAGPPPFLLTSAFPHAGSVRFYPAPQRLPQAVLDSGVAGKTVKKIRWLSAGALDLLRQGQALETAEANFLHGRTVWLTVKEREAIKHLLAEDDEGGSSLWRFQVVPHVTVDRASNASNLFHTGRVTFSPDCGLWFAVRGQANDVREAFGLKANLPNMTLLNFN
ncbi:MAG: hypothetical protein HYZ49_14295 [Chloroflexi bacterium]|nr:hypothetical protein [Chloroflexota bacterium]